MFVFFAEEGEGAGLVPDLLSHNSPGSSPGLRVTVVRLDWAVQPLAMPSSRWLWVVWTLKLPFREKSAQHVLGTQAHQL